MFLNSHEMIFNTLHMFSNTSNCSVALRRRVQVKTHAPYAHFAERPEMIRLHLRSGNTERYLTPASLAPTRSMPRGQTADNAQ